MKSKENGKTYNLQFIADRLAGKMIKGVSNEALLAQLPADVRVKAERFAGVQAREDAYADAHIIIEGQSIRETDKAILFRDEIAGENWYPRSQIRVISAISSMGRIFKIEVPKWLAIENGVPIE